MAQNESDVIISSIQECDELLLGGQMPLYDVAKNFLKIDHAVKNIKKIPMLEKIFQGCLEQSPDTPNIPLLKNKLESLKDKKKFGYMLQDCIKLMILTKIEDTLLFGSQCGLQNTSLYIKLERLFEKEQKRRYKISKKALVRSINFDQVFYEEDRLKQINFDNGINNFKDFISPFKMDGNGDDDDNDDQLNDDENDDDMISLSWDDDFEDFMQEWSDDDGGIGIGMDINSNMNDLVDNQTQHGVGAAAGLKRAKYIEALSDEENTSATYNVDDFVDMEDIVAKYTHGQMMDGDGNINGDANAMAQSMFDAKIDMPDIEPFVTYHTNDLKSYYEAQLDKYPHNWHNFSRLRPISNYRKIFSKRTKYNFAFQTKQNMLSHTKKKIPRSITYLNSEYCGGKDKSLEIKNLAEELFNKNLRTIMGHRKLKPEKGETMGEFVWDYLTTPNVCM